LKENKAKVDILKIQEVENNIIVEARITIGIIICNRRYTLKSNATKFDIEQYISNKIIEEENTDALGHSFEVNLNGN